MYNESLDLPMIQTEGKKRDVQGTGNLMSPALPDPIQPTIYYMEAVLPVELQSVTKLMHFSTTSIDSYPGKNILPPPFSRSTTTLSSMATTTSSSSVSSSLSSCSTLEDDDDTTRKSNGNMLHLDLLSKLMNEKQYYICNFCFKKFMRPSSLKIHVYSHTGEKPFKCTHPGCRRKFSVQSNMRRHLRVHSS